MPNNHITLKDIKSITDAELAFSTTRFLPEMEDIPAEFLRGNKYTNLIECLFYGTDLPSGEMMFHFDIEPNELNKFIRAHLKSFEPKHEHKIAGVGFLLSQLCTFEEYTAE